MNNENERQMAEIIKRMQAIDSEMNTVIGMVNSFLSPVNKRYGQPIGVITLLKKAVSAKLKIANFVLECEKRIYTYCPAGGTNKQAPGA